MKNLMVANMREKEDGRYCREAIETLVKAQIDNALELGWSRSDLMLLTNFEFSYSGVNAVVVRLNEFCWKGSKMWAVKWWMENAAVSEKREDVVWAHDLDCWQVVRFEEPEFRDVGIATYSQPKYNGGSVFWRMSAKDVVDSIIEELTTGEAKREEPTLNRILKSERYKDRVTVVDQGFNVGCSGWVKRVARSEKPVKVAHFHPYNRIAWETHALDRNGTGERTVSERLEMLLRRWYPGLAMELKKEKQKRKKKKGKKDDVKAMDGKEEEGSGIGDCK